jgi:hypothetical protein
MKQQTLAVSADQGAGFEQHRRVTRREEFLKTMNEIVPWSELCAVIEPYYPKKGNGRAPIGLEHMLRIHFMQHPRAMITDPNRYEPRANDTVLDFARHYGTSVLPARPYSPQDKAKVESAVQVVERWVMARLRHRQFATIHEVNEVIKPLLERLNARPFQKLPGNRASAFAELDVRAGIAAVTSATLRNRLFQNR